MQKNILSISLFLILAFILEAAPWRIKKFPGGRIVGGHDTTIEKHPHMASIQMKPGPVYILYCGASIISTEWVMTAAHCVQNGEVSSYLVRVGTTRIASGIDHKLSRIVINPKYFENPYSDDIALLQVMKPFQFGPRVLRVELAKTTPPERATVLVLGWGQLGAYKDRPDILQEVELIVENRRKCDIQWDDRVSESMLCAYSPGYDKGPCVADSGGPLIYQGRLAGIIAWGDEECVAPNHPAIFTDVARAKDWIYSVTGLR